MKLNSLDRLLKISPKTNFTKIRPVKAELFHADVHIDGRIEKQAWRSYYLLLAILWTRWKLEWSALRWKLFIFIRPFCWCV